MATAAKGAASTIAGLGDSVGMRQAILRQLGLAPGKLTGFKGDANFDQNISNLYLKGLQDTAELDTQEGSVNRNYAQNTADARIKNERARQNLQETSSGRGMLYSSDFANQLSNQSEDYGRYTKSLQAAKEATVNDIGRQRLNSDLAITRGVADQQRSYGQQLKDFISQQAIGSWVAETNAQQQRDAQAQQAAALRAIAAAQVPAPSATTPTTISAPRQRVPRTTGTTPQLDLSQLSTENLNKSRTRQRAQTPYYNNFVPFG